MTTHSVSYFRNHALELLDQVAAKGEEFVITRRGKPLAHVSPAGGKKRLVLGKMKGSMKAEGDVVGPLGDSDWSAAR